MWREGSDMKNIAFTIIAATFAQTALAMQEGHQHDEHDASVHTTSDHTAHAKTGGGSHTAHDMGDMGTDPWLNYVKIDQFEWRDADQGSIMAWDATAWSGKSIDKLWLNAEGERFRGHTEHAELQLLYSRAVSSYWDMQAGVRSDIDPRPDRHWATFGVRGLAPYYFDIDAQLFVADHGDTAARVNVEYEMMLTQKLALVPEFEINAYGKDDIERGIGSGLSSLETGLRLRYEIVREFAPYVGLTYERKLGDTADMARDADEERSETMLVVGVSAWL
jgi:copper resistance protein B